MALIKDLKNVKDEEITLLDVKRAEEIIERANKLLGRATIKENHYWHGWGYGTLTAPYQPIWYTTTTQGGSNAAICGTGSTTDSVNAVNLSNISLTEACAKILS